MSIANVMLSVAFLGLLSCTAPQVIVVSAHMSIRDYLAVVHKLPPSGGPGEASIGTAFPILGIFNSQGELIFMGTNVTTNTPMLRRSQCDLARMSSRSRSFNLGNIVDEVKEFRAYKARLLSGKRCTYLSITLEKCEACEIQDDLFEKADKSKEIVNKLSLVLRE